MPGGRAWPVRGGEPGRRSPSAATSPAQARGPRGQPAPEQLLECGQRAETEPPKRKRTRPCPQPRARHSSAGSATNSPAPETGPDATPSLTRGAPDRDRVEGRLVDAVEAEELVGPSVVVAAERHRREPESGRREQDVLGDVAGLDQREAITTQPVLEPGAPEDRRDEARRRSRTRSPGRSRAAATSSARADRAGSRARREADRSGTARGRARRPAERRRRAPAGRARRRRGRPAAGACVPFGRSSACVTP